MARITSSSSGGTVKIQDSDGNPIIANDGALVVVPDSGFSELSPGYPTQVTVGNTSSTILPANALRKYAHIINNTANPIFIQYSSVASLNQGIKINPGNLFTLSGGDLWLGDVNAIALIPGQLIDILEAI